MPAPALLEMFAAHAAGGWTPASLPGLVAWYDASNAGSITSSSGNVSQWNDLSGSGFHLVQGTGANQPDTGVNTLNGLNVIKFIRANSDRMTKSGISTTVTSVFGVFKNSYTTGTQVPCGTNADAFSYLLGSGGVINMFAGAGGSGSSNSTTNNTAFTAYCLINGASSVLNLNGTSTTTSTGTTTAATAIQVGDAASGGNYWNGDIAEFFMSSSLISGADLTSARTYLTGKWGTP